MEKKENKKVVKKATKKKVVKKTVKKTAKRTPKKAVKRINTAYKKVSKKQAEKLAPEDVVVLEDSGMSLKEFNIFARRNGLAPIEEIEAPSAKGGIGGSSKCEGKMVNLQGTARIVTKMTDYGRQLAEQSAYELLTPEKQAVWDKLNKRITDYGRQQAVESKPVQPVVNIVNTMDDKQVLEFMNSEEGERRITNIIRESAFNARRIQPLPDGMRRDTLKRDTLRGFTKDTLKPEYRTRTARAIAAIRHTAKDFWDCFKSMITGL